MSASDQIRAMLDQLMGTTGSTNSNNSEINNQELSSSDSVGLKYSDDSVCKLHLFGYCPHEVLQGTRMELGPCSQIHSLALRSDYQKDLLINPNLESEYLLEALDKLKLFINDSDRRTNNAKKKLLDQQSELTTPEVLEKLSIVKKLDEEISSGLIEAEKLGELGQIDESLELLSKIEQLRESKLSAELDYKKSIPPAIIQQQKLRVCHVCSSYLGINDNDRRLADHFGGKLHLGYIKLREGFDEISIKAEGVKKNRVDSSGVDSCLKNDQVVGNKSSSSGSGSGHNRYSGGSHHSNSSRGSNYNNTNRYYNNNNNRRYVNNDDRSRSSYRKEGNSSRSSRYRSRSPH